MAISNKTVESQKLKYFLLMSLLVFFLANPMAAAFATSKLSDFSPFKGVDTVLVSISIAPEHELLPKASQYHGADLWDAVLISQVQDIFSAHSWITVKRVEDVPVRDRLKQNILLLDYTISAQLDTQNNKSFPIAALTLQMRNYDDKGKDIVTSGLPAAYPFLIASDPEAFNHKIVEGVNFLTHYLPSYFVCANKQGATSQQCPDCRPDACQPLYPFEDKIKPACPKAKQGGTMPIPCLNR